MLREGIASIVASRGGMDRGGRCIDVSMYGQGYIVDGRWEVWAADVKVQGCTFVSDGEYLQKRSEVYVQRRVR